MATDKDLKYVKVIDRLCFPGIFRYSSKSFTRIFQNASLKLVAIEPTRRKPIGFLLANTYQSKFGNIARIAVHPEFQNQNIGRNLMHYSLARMIEMGLRNVTLNTQKDNYSARNLYEDLGFQLTETEMILGKTISYI